MTLTSADAEGPATRGRAFFPWVTFGISVLAWLIASAALIAVLIHIRTKPDLDAMMRAAGKEHLAKYSFSTPKDALLSQRRMEDEFDILAMIEYERQTDRHNAGRKKMRGGEGQPDFKEFAKTLEVRKEMEWKETKVIFFSFEEDGIKVYDFQGFQKQKASGFWIPKGYLDEFSVEKDNPVIGSYMRSWRTRGEFLENFKHRGIDKE